jgi:Arc/MetJ-type ribon-helix-helix transcriptional regulator
MYVMRRTTVYLPEELKADIERVAAAERRSEAEVIRTALREAVARRTPPRPRLPLFDDPIADPTAAERVDELLVGFGER